MLGLSETSLSHYSFPHGITQRDVTSGWPPSRLNIIPQQPPGVLFGAKVNLGGSVMNKQVCRYDIVVVRLLGVLWEYFSPHKEADHVGLDWVGLGSIGSDRVGLV